MTPDKPLPALPFGPAAPWVDPWILWAKYLLIFAIIVLVIFLLLTLWLRRKKNQPKLIPPGEKAFLDLAAIKRELLSLNSFLFYEKLSLCFRNYAQQAMSFDCLEKTTEEILPLLDVSIGQKISTTNLPKLKNFLLRAQEAQFGKVSFSKDEHQNDFTLIEDIIKNSENAKRGKK